MVASGRALARETACQALAEARTDQDGAVNVELLKDIRTAFGEDAAIRSADLVEKLIADPERPSAEWKRGQPLTQKQLGRLLKPFGICSETVHPPGLPHGRGYQRVRFEEAWEAYCPLVNTPLNPNPPFSKCASAQMPIGIGATWRFSKCAKSISAQGRGPAGLQTPLGQRGRRGKQGRARARV